jgi:ubiquinone/menaquinone biosynthesis C-methylase UbiE
MADAFHSSSTAERSRNFARLTRWFTPNRDSALAQYRSRAPIYDLELALLTPVRQRAIEMLGLKRGDNVLDVGCGTGLSFAALEQLIGAQGTVTGIEQSPEMLELARKRALENHWQNVTLIPSPIEDAAIPRAVDAALFHFTHDIMRTRNAVANVVKNVRPGGTIVAAGLKWAPLRSMALNPLVWGAAKRSTSTLEGLARPWSYLEQLVPNLLVEEMLAGTVFVVKATIPTPPVPPA